LDNKNTLAAIFLKIVSGEKRGIISAMWFCLFFLISLPLSVIVRIRNFLYDKELLPVKRVPVFTVSVGNLTLGGTGKTPMCAFLVRYFLDNGYNPGIISRGYGRSKSKNANNDEFLELAMQFPKVPHVQNPDRITAAKQLLEVNSNVNVIILDDAMQHRRIKRDVNLVLIDAAEPFGFNRLFPAGLLREPVSELRRTDAVILTRSDFVTEEKIAEIKQRCEKIAPNIIWAQTVHFPKELLTPEHQTVDISFISGKRVLAFCGIGNSEAFRRTLSGCGAETADFLVFPDHHRYDAEDLRYIKDIAVKCNVETIICTVKDLVKIPAEEMKETVLYAVSIQIRFLCGEEELGKLLRQ